jgi:hypothetical protein
VEFSVNIKRRGKNSSLSYLQLVEVFENGSVDSVEFVGGEVQLSQTHETLERVLIDADGAVGQVVARQVQQRKLRQACVVDKHKFGPINQVRFAEKCQAAVPRDTSETCNLSYLNTRKTHMCAPRAKLF